MIYAWRAILWSMIVAAYTSRDRLVPSEAVTFADEILKSFDERFDIQPSGNIASKKR